MRRLPDFIIIGAMKCGTSTLHEQLAAQPSIFMSTPKEPCFFSDETVWAKGIASYCALFQNALPNEICGESSTHYSMLPTYPEVAQRMKALLPDTTKFIYIMRDPIERLISHYMHDWSQGIINSPLDAAIDTYSELVDYGRYAYQLQPYLKLFGAERILPVFLEHMQESAEEELARIASFLGYTSEVHWEADRGRENVSAQRLRATPLLVLLRDFPGSRTLRRALLPENVREQIKSIWRLKARPQLNYARRATLEALYDEDLTVLGSWLGLNLSCRTFRAVAARSTPEWVASAYSLFNAGHN